MEASLLFSWAEGLRLVRHISSGHLLLAAAAGYAALPANAAEPIANGTRGSCHSSSGQHGVRQCAVDTPSIDVTLPGDDYGIFDSRHVEGQQ